MDGVFFFLFPPTHQLRIGEYGEALWPETGDWNQLHIAEPAKPRVDFRLDGWRGLSIGWKERLPAVLS